MIVTPDGDQFIGESLQKIDLTSNPDEAYERLFEALRKITNQGPEGIALPPGRPPYPGTMNFDTDDEAVFFRRAAETHQLIESSDGLRTTSSARVLQIHCESGAGKS